MRMGATLPGPRPSQRDPSARQPSARRPASTSGRPRVQERPRPPSAQPRPPSARTRSQARDEAQASFSGSLSGPGVRRGSAARGKTLVDPVTREKTRLSVPDVHPNTLLATYGQVIRRGLAGSTITGAGSGPRDREVLAEDLLRVRRENLQLEEKLKIAGTQIRRLEELLKASQASTRRAVLQARLVATSSSRRQKGQGQESVVAELNERIEKMQEEIENKDREIRKLQQKLNASTDGIKTVLGAEPASKSTSRRITILEARLKALIEWIMLLTQTLKKPRHLNIRCGICKTKLRAPVPRDKRINFNSLLEIDPNFQMIVDEYYAQQNTDAMASSFLTQNNTSRATGSNVSTTQKEQENDYNSTQDMATNSRFDSIGRSVDEGLNYDMNAINDYNSKHTGARGRQDLSQHQQSQQKSVTFSNNHNRYTVPAPDTHIDPQRTSRAAVKPEQKSQRHNESASNEQDMAKQSNTSNRDEITWGEKREMIRYRPSDSYQESRSSGQQTPSESNQVIEEKKVTKKTYQSNTKPGNSMEDKDSIVGQISERKSRSVREYSSRHDEIPSFSNISKKSAQDTSRKSSMTQSKTSFEVKTLNASNSTRSSELIDEDEKLNIGYEFEQAPVEKGQSIQVSFSTSSTQNSMNSMKNENNPGKTSVINNASVSKLNEQRKTSVSFSSSSSSSSSSVISSIEDNNSSISHKSLSTAKDSDIPAQLGHAPLPQKDKRSQQNSIHKNSIADHSSKHESSNKSNSIHGSRDVDGNTSRRGSKADPINTTGVSTHSISKGSRDIDNQMNDPGVDSKIAPSVVQGTVATNTSGSKGMQIEEKVIEASHTSNESSTKDSSFANKKNRNIVTADSAAKVDPMDKKHTNNIDSKLNDADYMFEKMPDDISIEIDDTSNDLGIGSGRIFKGSDPQGLIEAPNEFSVVNITSNRELEQSANGPHSLQHGPSKQSWTNSDSSANVISSGYNSNSKMSNDNAAVNKAENTTDKKSVAGKQESPLAMQNQKEIGSPKKDTLNSVGSTSYDSEFGEASKGDGKILGSYKKSEQFAEVSESFEIVFSENDDHKNPNDISTSDSSSSMTSDSNLKGPISSSESTVKFDTRPGTSETGNGSVIKGSLIVDDFLDNKLAGEHSANKNIEKDISSHKSIHSSSSITGAGMNGDNKKIKVGDDHLPAQKKNDNNVSNVEDKKSSSRKGSRHSSFDVVLAGKSSISLSGDKANIEPQAKTSKGEKEQDALNGQNKEIFNDSFDNPFNSMSDDFEFEVESKHESNNKDSVLKEIKKPELTVVNNAHLEKKNMSHLANSVIADSSSSFSSVNNLSLSDNPLEKKETSNNGKKSFDSPKDVIANAHDESSNIKSNLDQKMPHRSPLVQAQGSDRHSDNQMLNNSKSFSFNFDSNSQADEDSKKDIHLSIAGDSLSFNMNANESQGSHSKKNTEDGSKDNNNGHIKNRSKVENKSEEHNVSVHNELVTSTAIEKTIHNSKISVSLHSGQATFEKKSKNSFSFDSMQDRNKSGENNPGKSIGGKKDNDDDGGKNASINFDLDDDFLHSESEGKKNGNEKNEKNNSQQHGNSIVNDSRHSLQEQVRKSSANVSKTFVINSSQVSESFSGSQNQEPIGFANKIVTGTQKPAAQLSSPLSPSPNTVEIHASDSQSSSSSFGLSSSLSDDNKDKKDENNKDAEKHEEPVKDSHPINKVDSEQPAKSKHEDSFTFEKSIDFNVVEVSEESKSSQKGSKKDAAATNDTNKVIVGAQTKGPVLSTLAKKKDSFEFDDDFGNFDDLSMKDDLMGTDDFMKTNAKTDLLTDMLRNPSTGSTADGKRPESSGPATGTKKSDEDDIHNYTGDSDDFDSLDDLLESDEL